MISSGGTSCQSSPHKLPTAFRNEGVGDESGKRPRLAARQQKSATARHRRQHARRVRYPENVQHRVSLSCRLVSKCELQHLDPGRDFDVLVANDKIQRRVGRLGWSCGLIYRRIRLGRFFARRAFIPFVSHIQSTNNIELPGRTCDLIEHFSRC